MKARSAIEQSFIYLARREYARPELEYKLRSKGYSSDEIERALSELESGQLLSHRRFLEEYIRGAMRKGYGPTKIRWELKHAKRLEESEIDEAISEMEIDWVASARQCYEKKFGAEPVKDIKERFRRGNYLSRRGFPMDIVRQVLESE